jgi:serine phosphatase RsbU (regulator of sigma subunit)
MLRFSSLLLLLFPLCLFAQSQKKIDSLERALKTETSDTSKANAYVSLADQYRYSDPVKHRQYALKGINLSREIGHRRALAASYNLYGIAMENEGRYDAALSYYDSALVTWKRAGNLHEQGRVYLNMANAYNRTADYPAAADYTIRSLKVQESVKDTFGVAVCQLTLGNIYYKQGDTEAALRAYQEAQALNESSVNNVGFSGSALSNIGAMYQQLEKYDSSLYYFRTALSLFASKGMTTKLGSTYSNIGTVWSSLGRNDSAMHYYRLGLSSHIKYDNPEGTTSALASIGNLHLDLSEMDSALFYYNKALLISKQIGTREQEMNLYYGISNAYKYKQDSAKALVYLQLYVDLNDSLHGQGQTIAIEELKKAYELDKKNQDVLMAEAQARLAEETNRRNMILFGSGGLLFIVVTGVGVIMYRNKQRYTHVLEKKNEEIFLQNKIIAEKNKDITDSITYARRIQQSVMPDERILRDMTGEYFVLNRPRDIVSGDFLWLAEKEGRTYLAVADCTGHGVPGALVSVIGINLLNKVIEQPGRPSPSEILELVHAMMIASLNKDKAVRETNDGMDVALICFDREAGKVIFSGAGRPLYYRDSRGFHFLKGDRFSVAGEKKDGDAPFTDQEIPLEPGMSFYLSSDGYVDQFGEHSGKKFLSKRFSELLAEISTLPMPQQSARLEQAFMNWKGNLEQIDDILVVGVKV